MKRNEKTAIVLGATGLTGAYLLEILLQSKEYKRVKVFTRRSTGKTHEKLEEIVCDLLKLEEQYNRFKADEVFCCIGTTKAKTPDKKLYHNIDYGIPVSSAKLSEQNNIPTFSVISAIGSNVKSSIFYSRTKGEMEETILKLNIPNILIYRPSLIYGNRKDNRLFEKMGLLFTKILQLFFVGKMKNYKSIHAKELAKALYFGAQHRKAHQVIYKEQFNLKRDQI
ncbi:MAG: nucleoside-diphosphate sugar epimerase [Candidatus Cloacimonadota bacterium]|nr:MAG: nucleoside-diphosphate sugar epimerase [Candidatus Cloacimonadota bacterium]PIE79068.1 MAG: nucleoside-diphosphate sugar epimerase [Candidatus Delongbacteria bacterium]